MAQAAARRERLEARITPEQKALLQQAAGLQGRSVTDFVISSAQAAAEETIRAHQIVLTAKDSALFVEALLNPPEPNEHLINALRRHREFTGEQ
ncbi:MAG: DUF1778 domain-containing protein [Chloroflexi bacterium]|nr:DUF1778 domain-containing protein [Chloroflexota bacterium]